MSDYFVIDGRVGSTMISKHTKKEFLDTFQNGGFGPPHSLEFTTDDVLNYDRPICISEPGRSGFIVIKGEIVVPEPKPEVITWEIP